MSFERLFAISSNCAGRAWAAKHTGKPGPAKHFSERAIRFGRLALDQTPDNKPGTLGIVVLHVCALMYKSGDVDGARQLAQRYIDAEIPEYYSDQLRQIHTATSKSEPKPSPL